jgi:hypothetical protein
VTVASATSGRRGRIGVSGGLREATQRVASLVLTAHSSQAARLGAAYTEFDTAGADPLKGRSQGVRRP